MNIVKDKRFAYKIGLTKRKTNYESVRITGAQDAAKYIKQFYANDIGLYESAFILLLNKQNCTIGYAKISQGGISSTVVDISIIAKYCVDTLASGCIFAHNHPSGNLEPSTQDTDMTEKLKNALSLFDCTLLDSIILTEQGAYSIIHNHSI